MTEEFIKQNRDLSEVILHNTQLWRVLEDALSFVRTVRDAPEKTHDWMRANGIVLNDLDDRMQKTAFSVYTDLVSLSNQARELLDDIYEEALSSSPANPYAAAVSAIKREAAHDLESLVACTIYSMAEKALVLLDGEKGGGGRE